MLFAGHLMRNLTRRVADLRAESVCLPDPISVACDGLPHPEANPVVATLREGCERLLGCPTSLTESGQATLTLRLTRRASEGDALPAEGFCLRLEKDRVRLEAPDLRGLFHAVHAWHQMLAVTKFGVPLACGKVMDWPHYRVRSLMLDLGRAPFTLPLLRRTVRLCSHLGLNALHLHLHENELNPVRYPGTPLGSENPWALDLSDYEQLIRYAQAYAIEVIPELEAWGHAGSLLQHRPDLYGASRLHGEGHAFGIGPETERFLETIFDAWLAILPDGAKIHLGLDEANWAWLPGADRTQYTRQTLVPRLHGLLRERARAHGKQAQTMMWIASEEERVPVPPSLQPEIIGEPYWYQAHREMIPLLVQNAIAKPAMPFVFGAGICTLHEVGALVATDQWARLACDIPHCLGGELCVWGTNDLTGRLLGIFGGAELLWRPDAMGDAVRSVADWEFALAGVAARMRTWQELMPDMRSEEFIADRGPEVWTGRYRTGPHIGEPIVPRWMPDRPQLGDAEG